MKRLLWIILCVFLGIDLFSKIGVESVCATPPALKDSTDITTYTSYVITNNIEWEFPVYPGLILNDDYTFDIWILGKQYKQGEWRVSGDTLFCYGTEDLWADTAYTNALLREMELDSTITDFRQALMGLHFRETNSSQFAMNTAVFKIIDAGDKLIGIDDIRETVCNAVSAKDGRKNRGYLFDSYDWPSSTPDSVKSKPKPKPNWKDSLIWHKIHYPGPVQTFTVDSVLVRENEVLKVTMSNDGITYNVVNPAHYSCVGISRSNNNFNNEWMRHVSRGSKIRLKLSRPPYSKETITNVPELQTTQDSVFAMSDETYGYWFATPIN